MVDQSSRIKERYKICDCDCDCVDICFCGTFMCQSIGVRMDRMEMNMTMDNIEKRVDNEVADMDDSMIDKAMRQLVLDMHIECAHKNFKELIQIISN